MALPREIHLLRPDPTRTQLIRDNPYHAARDKLRRLLIHYSLLESYHKFSRSRTPYPFVSPQSLRPGAITGTREYELHNSALVFLVGEEVPSRLRKHFRCREGNRVLKRNIAAVSPNHPLLDRFDYLSREITHPGFEALMRFLLPLDFGLLVQPEDLAERHPPLFHLSHFHVKIERLTDNALKEMGRHLNYLENSLYELDDDFIDHFERKFFEYFNFYHNAAGRRSAAALAAQMLAREKLNATVFVASQQDRRLTLLTSTGPSREVLVQQFVLLRMDGEEARALKEWGRRHGLNIHRHYLLADRPSYAVALLRLNYEHTNAATPSPKGQPKASFNMRERWIRLVEETLVPVHPDANTCINYPVAYRRGVEEDPATFI